MLDRPVHKKFQIWWLLYMLPLLNVLVGPPVMTAILTIAVGITHVILIRTRRKILTKTFLKRETIYLVIHISLVIAGAGIVVYLFNPHWHTALEKSAATLQNRFLFALAKTTLDVIKEIRFSILLLIIVAQLNVVILSLIQSGRINTSRESDAWFSNFSLSYSVIMAGTALFVPALVFFTALMVSTVGWFVFRILPDTGGRLFSARIAHQNIVIKRKQVLFAVILFSVLFIGMLLLPLKVYAPYLSANGVQGYSVYAGRTPPQAFDEGKGQPAFYNVAYCTWLFHKYSHILTPRAVQKTKTPNTSQQTADSASMPDTGNTKTSSHVSYSPVRMKYRTLYTKILPDVAAFHCLYACMSTLLIIILFSIPFKGVSDVVHLTLVGFIGALAASLMRPIFDVPSPELVHIVLWIPALLLLYFLYDMVSLRRLLGLYIINVIILHGIGRRGWGMFTLMYVAMNIIDRGVFEEENGRFNQPWYCAIFIAYGIHTVNLFIMIINAFVKGVLKLKGLALLRSTTHGADYHVGNLHRFSAYMVIPLFLSAMSVFNVSISYVRFLFIAAFGAALLDFAQGRIGRLGIRHDHIYISAYRLRPCAGEQEGALSADGMFGGLIVIGIILAVAVIRNYFYGNDIIAALIVLLAVHGAVFAESYIGARWGKKVMLGDGVVNTGLTLIAVLLAAVGYTALERFI